MSMAPGPRQPNEAPRLAVFRAAEGRKKHQRWQPTTRPAAVPIVPRSGGGATRAEARGGGAFGVTDGTVAITGGSAGATAGAAGATAGAGGGGSSGGAARGAGVAAAGGSAWDGGGVTASVAPASRRFVSAGTRASSCSQALQLVRNLWRSATIDRMRHQPNGRHRHHNDAAHVRDQTRPPDPGFVLAFDFCEVDAFGVIPIEREAILLRGVIPIGREAILLRGVIPIGREAILLRGVIPIGRPPVRAAILLRWVIPIGRAAILLRPDRRIVVRPRRRFVIELLERVRRLMLFDWSSAHGRYQIRSWCGDSVSVPDESAASPSGVPRLSCDIYSRLLVLSSTRLNKPRSRCCTAYSAPTLESSLWRLECR